jgi:tRNA A22 N-methylase
VFAQDSELYDAEAVKYQEQLDGAAALERERAAQWASVAGMGGAS